jgi:hypothetical protein
MNNNNEYTFYHKSDLNETVTKSANTGLFELPATIVKSVSGQKSLKSGQATAPFNIIIRKGKSANPNDYIKPQPSIIMNYPNPFSSGTTIKFSLPEKEDITLTIFDIVGRRIEEITKGNYNAGIHNIYWQNKNILPGIYLLELKTPSGTDILKINHQL